MKNTLEPLRASDELPEEPDIYRFLYECDEDSGAGNNLKPELTDEQIKELKRRLAGAINQRNEAQERIDQLLKEREEAIQQSMRDARRADANAALCSKLRDIAERAITVAALWAGSRTNSASGLRAELDRLKKIKD